MKNAKNNAPNFEIPEKSGKFRLINKRQPPKIHDLKILPEYFSPVVAGIKTYEYRFNDRDYSVGDMLILREFKDGKYTGQQITVTVTHILKDFEGLKEGWVIMAIKEFKKGRNNA